MKTKDFFSLLVIGSLLLNCSSGGDDPMPQPNPDPDPDPDPTAVTYNGDIKSIMTSNCTSCHGNPPTNSAPMSLTTYAQVKDAVENRGLVARINSTTNPMPPAPNGMLSQANRNLIQQWVDDGLLEN